MSLQQKYKPEPSSIDYVSAWISILQTSMDMDGQPQQVSLGTHTSWISISACKLTGEAVAFLSWYVVKNKTP